MTRLYALLTGLLLIAAPAAASPMWFTTTLSGATENPPTGSSAMGWAKVRYDPVTHMLEVMASFSGLTGTTTASHIHCCTTVSMTGNAGVATELPTFAMFPLGVTWGSFSEMYDLTNPSSFNPTFVTAQGSLAAAETALVTGMMDGTAYFNIHTSAFPGGEVRGFLAPDVPEPATLMLIGAGLFGVWRLKRKAKVKAA